MMVGGAEQRPFVRLFGTPRVEVVGETVVPPRRIWSLLTALALQPQPRSRDELADLVRPDLPPPDARRRLNHLLWVFGRELPQLPLRRDPDCVWVPASTRDVDVEVLREAREQDDPEALREALELCEHGDIAEPLPDAPWLAEARAAARNDRSTVVLRAGQRLIDRNLPHDAADIVAPLCREEPLHEPALRILATALHAQGRHDEADAALARLQGALEDRSPDTAGADHGASNGIGRAAVHEPHPVTGGDGHDPARLAFERGELAHAEELLRDRADEPGRALLQADLAIARGQDRQAERFLRGRDDAAATVRRAGLARRRGELQRARDHALAALHASAGAPGRHLNGTPNADERTGALVELARVALLTGQTEHALAYATEARPTGVAAPTPRLACQAQVVTAASHLLSGRLRAAMTAALDAEDVAARHRWRPERAEALVVRGRAHGRSGDLASAVTCHQQAVAIWDELGLDRERTNALSALAISLRRAGDWESAMERAREAAARAAVDRDRPAVLAGAHYAFAVASLAATKSRAASVLDLLRHAQWTGTGQHDPSWEARRQTLRGLALLLRSDDEAARSTLENARMRKLECGELGELPQLDALITFALVRLGRSEEACARARTAVDGMVTGLGEIDASPVVHYAMGRALLAVGADGAAANQLAEGVQHLEALAASFPDAESREKVRRRDPFTRGLVATAEQCGIGPARLVRQPAAPTPN